MRTSDGNNEPGTAGEGASNGAIVLTQWLISLLGGVVMMVVPLACIYLDLTTGPSFIDDFTATNGLPLSGLGGALPFLVSVGTTGLQYALFDRLRLLLEHRGEGKLEKKTIVLIVIAAAVALGDTAVDAGGVTGWRYPPSEAANIIPNSPDLAWLIQVTTVSLLCLLHEPLLQALLKRFKDNAVDVELAGAVLIQGGIKAGGWILNTAKAVALPLGALSMILLDLVLTPQIGTTAAMTFTLWVVSLAFSGFQYMLWEHHERVGIKRASKLDKILVPIGWGMAVLDTFLDVIGYTTAIYGDGTRVVVIPDDPSWVWALGVLITAALCFAGERMLKEMLKRPGKDGSSGGGDTPWSNDRSDYKI